MQFRRLVLVCVPVLAWVLAGCGGSGGNSSRPGSLTENLRFAGGIEYVGSYQPMTGDRTILAQGQDFAYVSVGSSRRLIFQLPGGSLSNDEVFRVGVDPGISVAYTEVRDNGLTYAWKGSSGTIRANWVGDHWVFTLTDLQIVKNGAVIPNDARGAAVISGTIEARDAAF